MIHSLQNTELDLQQEEYALSKDIDVSLWTDFREFYDEMSLHCKKSWAELLFLSMKTCMLSLLNSEGKSDNTLEQHVVWLKEVSSIGKIS